MPLHTLTRTGKTFFFADYEGLRRLQRAPLTATIPTSTQLKSLLNGAPSLDSSGNAIRLKILDTKVVYSNGVISAPIPFANIVLNDLSNVQNVTGQSVVAAKRLHHSPPTTVNSGPGRISALTGPSAMSRSLRATAKAMETSSIPRPFRSPITESQMGSPSKATSRLPLAIPGF